MGQENSFEILEENKGQICYFLLSLSTVWVEE